MSAAVRFGRSVRDVAVALAVSAGFTTVGAQAPPPQGRGNVPSTARSSAPIDLTGNWVSIVSEDWRWRMVTPARGDYSSVPLNDAAMKVADAWDPAKDEAAGLQCKSYGAPAIMRVPGRLRISWQDDNTLKVETDAGIQTRLFQFGTPKTSGPRTWQGQAVAEWRFPRIRTAANGTLKVVTTNLRAGYLRKNGIPYSEKAIVTEYWELLKEPNGEQWIVITTVVEDPEYLSRPWETALHFKKEADGSKWSPVPCSASW